jgi:hypothetical protein
MASNGEDKFVDAEVSEEVSTPGSSMVTTQQGRTPVTVSELAEKLGVGLEIMKARITILQTARKAALRMTVPEDFLLFKDKEGRIVCYLQDCGCDRVRDIYGISIYGVSKPEKIIQTDQSFTYILSGNGKCALTGQVVENIEGGRSSTDDYIVKQKPPLTGAALELAVRKSARANLDGSITRELAGLQSVPLEEIMECYKGDALKTRARFREGRGFGSQSERSQQGEKAPDSIEAPVCPNCKVDMIFRSGEGKSGPYAFWGCKNFKERGCKESIDHKEWIAVLEKKKSGKPANGNGHTEEGETRTASQVINELNLAIAAIGRGDNTQTPDGICKRYFKIKAKGDQPAKEFGYQEVRTWTSESNLNWIHGAVKKMLKDFASILPPPIEDDGPEQQEMPL